MAKTWYVETTADKSTVLTVAREVFFSKPTMGTRMKVWSKAAQLQSNIRWEPANVSGSDVAARVVSGGMRELASSGNSGTGSMIGTTIALSIQASDGGSRVTLGLAEYNTYMGLNVQSDLLKSYSKQVATALTQSGHTASASKR